jgi:ubiquinone/menaquinone biosynthesis C-methylase UbiE
MQAQMMYQRRPDWLELIIAEDYKLVSQPDFYEKHYKRNGLGTYEFLGAAALSSTLIRDTFNRLGRPVRVLDVGTGAGHVVKQALQAGHQAQGVTALDFRKTLLNQGLGDDNYIVGDVHRLRDLPKIQSEYDVVLSRWTLRHLPDPLSVIEQMADLVADGGTLAVDAISQGAVKIKYRTEVGTVYGFPELNQDLDLAGFQLHPVSERFVRDTPLGLPFHIHDIVAIRLTSGPVRFAVDYEQSYQPA